MARGKHIKRTLAVVAIVLAVAGGWFAYSVIHTLRGVRDAYAQWDTGVLLIDYMDANDGRWPSQWSDLRSFAKARIEHEAGDKKWYGPESFDDLQRMVGVNWAADPKLFAAAGRAGRIAWPLSGNETLWSGGNPNEIVLAYLRQRATTRPLR